MDMTLFLKRLVETESPSHDKAAVDRVGAIIAEEARKLGAQVGILSSQQTGDHILARFHPSRTAVSYLSSVPILILCHMDTVFPLGTIDRFPFREAEGKIMGPRHAGYEGRYRHRSGRYQRSRAIWA